MITADCIDRVLPIVADSWEQLRGCDVDRLLLSVDFRSADDLHEAGRLISQKRPDLAGCVSEAIEDLLEEHSRLYEEDRQRGIRDGYYDESGCRYCDACISEEEDFCPVCGQSAH